MKQFIANAFVGRAFGMSLLLVAGAALAAPHAHREHGAHEHGVAALTLAFSDRDLAVEFDSPAVNLIGFEHAATSAKDSQAVAETAEKLRAPLTWLRLPAAAQCAVIKTTVESELLGNATDSVPADHDGHEHEGHADFTAKYQLQCKALQALDVVDMQLFDTFKGIEKIKAQWLTSTAQNAKVLTPADHMIRLQ